MAILNTITKEIFLKYSPFISSKTIFSVQVDVHFDLITKDPNGNNTNMLGFLRVPKLVLKS